MSLYIVDIHGELEGDYEIVRKYEDQEPTDKNFTKADIDAIVKAINEGWELRVNEILSKIRAEIEQLQPNLRPEQMTDYDYAMVEVVDDIVAILDKYKADKEQEDES